MAGEPFGQDFQAGQAHVNRDGLVFAGQHVPVQIQHPVAPVGGDENAGLGVVAVGQGDAGIGGAAGGRGDARHHLKGDVVFGQHLDFLAAAPEDEGIAPL